MGLIVNRQFGIQRGQIGWLWGHAASNQIKLRGCRFFSEHRPNVSINSIEASVPRISLVEKRGKKQWATPIFSPNKTTNSFKKTWLLRISWRSAWHYFGEGKASVYQSIGRASRSFELEEELSAGNVHRARERERDFFFVLFLIWYIHKNKS